MILPLAIPIALAVVPLTTPAPPAPAEAAPAPPGPAGEEGTRVRAKDGAEMVRVPAGPFRMGSTPGELGAARAVARRFRVPVSEEELAAETPPHQVELPAFYVDRLEVTNRRYLMFVRETGHDVPTNSFGPEYNVWADGTYPERIADHPVVNVSWEDAVAYCAWAGARLPTEAEWEKAARGVDGRQYPWASHWDEGRANRGRYKPDVNEWKGDAQDGFLNTAPVGSFPRGRSPYGADDMAGNALEWVQDRFTPGYGAAPGGSPAVPGEDDGDRVLRGGSWYYTPVRLRTTFRHHLPPDERNGHVGFRCAMSAAPPAPTPAASGR